jgi:CMP-N-acetylneuraminic acid synthetase
MRPSEFATDSSTDIEYIKHAIDWYDENEGYVPEYWVLLRPTTPLREPEIIEDAINKIVSTPDATSLISIHEFAETPGKMFGMQDGLLHGLCPMDPRPEYFTLPRQEFAPAYFGNGYVDIIKSSTVLDKSSCFGSRMLGFEAPDTGEIDIPDDIRRVEYYLSQSSSSIYEKLQNMRLI